MDRKNIPVRQRSSAFHAATFVWSRADLDLLFDVCLPYQLAAGNLPALPEGSRYRILTQPIHQDDVTACLVAALDHAWRGPHSLVVAGPVALRYTDFVRAVAAAAGLAPPRIVAVPAWLLMAASPLTLLPLLPRIRPAEIRRLLEDKAFDIAPMIEQLGVTPRSLADGLRGAFAR